MKEKNRFQLMRQLLFIVLSILMQSAELKSQAIHQNIKINVPCCSHADSIDFGNDGIYDIKIESHSSFDFIVNIIAITPLQNQIEVSDQSTDSGMQFLSFKKYGEIASTPFGCIWGQLWEPNSRSKYVGFRRFNSINDTTYGWIKLDFQGQKYNCLDTIYGKDLAYNLKSNTRLFAGQESPFGAIHSKTKQAEIIFPNPNSGNFTIASDELNIESSLIIFNNVGQTVYKTNISKSPFRIDTDLASGVYLVEVTINNKVLNQRIVVYK